MAPGTAGGLPAAVASAGGSAGRLRLAEIDLAGERTKVALFVMTLPYCDALFMQAFPRECTEAFQEGHQRENLLLVGPSGTGKTHVAIALAMAACLAGRKVRFFRVTELITTLLEARDEKSLLGLRRQLAKQDVIVLDELGYVFASKAGAELLFDLVGQAYEPAVRELARGPGKRASHWRRPRPAHPSLSHPGIHRRKLSTPGRPPPAPIQDQGVTREADAGRPGIIPASTQRCTIAAPGAARFQVLPQSW